MIIETKDRVNTFYAKARGEWGKWLEKNHQPEKSVWLILYNKESKTPSVNMLFIDTGKEP